MVYRSRDVPADERGHFARTWCRDEFARHGLESDIAQCNTSFNVSRGTLRGLHYQVRPSEEAKLVRCTRGRVYDVIVDIRRHSTTFGRWFAAELSDDNATMLYVPRGFAHGYQTLEANTVVFYQMSVPYAPEDARGIRWDDPWLAIPWPLPQPIISDQDLTLPLFAT